MTVVVAADGSGRFDGSTGKNITAHGADRTGDGDLGQGFTAGKSRFADRGDALRNHNRVQLDTRSECICGNGGCPAELVVIITAHGAGRLECTVDKSGGPYVCHRCRYDNLTQVAAFCKGSKTNGSYSVVDRYRGKIFTTQKCLLTDAGATVYDDLFDRGILSQGRGIVVTIIIIHIPFAVDGQQTLAVQCPVQGITALTAGAAAVFTDIFVIELMGNGIGVALGGRAGAAGFGIPAGSVFPAMTVCSAFGGTANGAGLGVAAGSVFPSMAVCGAVLENVLIVSADLAAGTTHVVDRRINTGSGGFQGVRLGNFLIEGVPQRIALSRATDGTGLGIIAGGIIPTVSTTPNGIGQNIVADTTYKYRIIGAGVQRIVCRSDLVANSLTMMGAVGEIVVVASNGDFLPLFLSTGIQHMPQITTIIKSTCLDFDQSIRKNQIAKLLTLIESPCSDGGAAINIGILQTGIGKGFVADFCLPQNGDRIQVFQIIECAVSNGRDARGDGDLSQPIAEAEGRITDGGDMISNADRGQLIPTVKTIFTDGSNIRGNGQLGDFYIVYIDVLGKAIAHHGRVVKLDLQPCRQIVDIDIGQLLATHESCSGDLFQTGTHGDGGQFFAVLKGMGSNICYTIRDGNGNQDVVPGEGASLDRNNRQAFNGFRNV